MFFFVFVFFFLFLFLFATFHGEIKISNVYHIYSVYVTLTQRWQKFTSIVMYCCRSPQSAFWTMVVVWRTRWKIIRTVPCCIV